MFQIISSKSVLLVFCCALSINVSSDASAVRANKSGNAGRNNSSGQLHKTTRKVSVYENGVHSIFRKPAKNKDLSILNSLSRRSHSELPKDQIRKFDQVGRNNGYSSKIIKLSTDGVGALAEYYKHHEPKFKTGELKFETRREAMKDGENETSHLITRAIVASGKYDLIAATSHTAAIAAVEYAKSKGTDLSKIKDANVMVLSTGFHSPDAQHLVKLSDANGRTITSFLVATTVSEHGAKSNEIKAMTFTFGRNFKESETVMFSDPFTSTPSEMNEMNK